MNPGSSSTEPVQMFRGIGMLRQDPAGLATVGWLSLALLSQGFIPFAGAIIAKGWTALLARRVIEGREGSLPPLSLDFDLLGKLLGAGFKPFLVSFLWGLPVGLIVGGVFGVGYVATVLIAATSADPELAVGAFACFGLVSLLLMPLVIVLQLPASVAGLKSELADDISAGLAVGAVLGFFRANMGTLIKGAIGYLFAGLLLMPIGLLLCYIPVFPIAAALNVGWNVFLADVYRAHVARGGAPFEVRPITYDPAQGPTAPPGQIGPGGAPGPGFGHPPSGY